MQEVQPPFHQSRRNPTGGWSGLTCPILQSSSRQKASQWVPFQHLSEKQVSPPERRSGLRNFWMRRHRVRDRRDGQTWFAVLWCSKVTQITLALRRLCFVIGNRLIVLIHRLCHLHLSGIWLSVDQSYRWVAELSLSRPVWQTNFEPATAQYYVGSSSLENSVSSPSRQCVTRAVSGGSPSCSIRIKSAKGTRSSTSPSSAMQV